MDINEQIVITWLEQCKGLFTRNNIHYGQYHSDIDILAINLKTSIAWDCEVKVRTSTTKIANTDNPQNGFNRFVRSLNSEERDEKVLSILPKNTLVVKKFITTNSLFGKSEENISKWEQAFKDRNIEVIFFDEIIKDLFEFASKTPKTSNDVIQVLKMFSIYNK